MACRSVLRSVMASEPWRPLHQSGSFRSFPSRNFGVYSSGRANCGYPATAEARNVRAIRPARFYSSRHGAPDADHDQAPPHEAVLKAISEVSKTEGRVGQTTNVIIGSTGTDDAIDEWFALDKKVNSYPTVRGFIAIGTGGDDFVQSMVVAVESVIRQSIPQERVRQKLSSRGKYVSVNIGPVRVVSSEQVQAVYNAMRRDDRMKYFLFWGRDAEAWPRMVLQGSMEDKMAGSIAAEQYRSGLMLLESTTRYNYEDAFVEQIFGKPISLSSPTEDLRVAVLYTRSVEDQAEAVALLISLARDNDRYRKSIIEEGRVGPLLKW